MKAFLVGLWVPAETGPRVHSCEPIMSPFPAGKGPQERGRVIDQHTPLPTLRSPSLRARRLTQCVSSVPV